MPRNFSGIQSFFLKVPKGATERQRHIMSPRRTPARFLLHPGCVVIDLQTSKSAMIAETDVQQEAWLEILHQVVTIGKYETPSEFHGFWWDYNGMFTIYTGEGFRNHPQYIQKLSQHVLKWGKNKPSFQLRSRSCLYIFTFATRELSLAL